MNIGPLGDTSQTSSIAKKNIEARLDQDIKVVSEIVNAIFSDYGLAVPPTLGEILEDHTFTQEKFESLARDFTTIEAADQDSFEASIVELDKKLADEEELLESSIDDINDNLPEADKFPLENTFVSNVRNFIKAAKDRNRGEGDNWNEYMQNLGIIPFK